MNVLSCGQRWKNLKLRQRLLSGEHSTSIDFETLCTYLNRLGFSQRINGSHHIFYRADIAEILNLQPKQGKAKPYQAKQLRHIILKYDLQENNDD